MRGDLVSRPIGEVMHEAERLLQAGVKELLVISQDTSAYGVDVKYRTGFWDGRPLKTRMTELARSSRAGPSPGAWVRLHYVYPYPHVDEVIPLMRPGRRPAALPRRAVPARQPAHPQADEASRRAGEACSTGIEAWRAAARIVMRSTFIVGFPGETEAEFEELLAFLEEAQLDRVGCFAYSPVEGAAANALPDAVPEDVKEERLARFMEVQRGSARPGWRRALARRSTVLVDGHADEGRGRAKRAWRSRAAPPTRPRSTAPCASPTAGSSCPGRSRASPSAVRPRTISTACSRTEGEGAAPLARGRTAAACVGGRSAPAARRRSAADGSTSDRRQYVPRVSRDHQLLVGRNRPRRHAARRGADARAVGGVGRRVDLDAKPRRVATHALAQRPAVFADSRGEHDRVESAGGRRERASSRPIR